MTVKKLIEKLTKAGNKPCIEATEFALQFKTPQEAWEACERGDWLLWAYARLPGMDRTNLVLCACKCARRSLKYITDKTEKRPLLAIEAAEKWANEPTKENADSVARAARAARAASAAWAASVASVASVAWAASAARAASAASADSVASVAWAASAASARQKERKAQAKLIRKIIPSIENLLKGFENV